MQFKYILYLLFLTIFACEHHSSNINIKNKPEDTKSIVKKKEIKETQKKNTKEELLNIVYSNKGFALIYSEDKVNSLEYKLDNASIDSMGVIAQDVEKVFPELVHGEEGKKSLQYSGLIGALIESIKELSAKVATLESGS